MNDIFRSQEEVLVSSISLDSREKGADRRRPVWQKHLTQTIGKKNQKKNMNSMPGAFPGLTPTSRRTERGRPERARPERFRHRSEHSEINYIKSLKSRKALFKNDFILNLECISYVYTIIAYLYDCSLLLLIIRSLLLFSVSALIYNSMLYPF